MKCGLHSFELSSKSIPLKISELIDRDDLRLTMVVADRYVLSAGRRP